MHKDRPTNKKTMSKIGFFARIAALIAEATEGGKSVNKNNIYARHGVGIGNPIFTPKRTKFKGYMRK